MRKGLTNLPHIWSYTLLHCKSFIDIEINEITMTISNNTALLAFQKKVYCHSTHHGCIYTVLTCWASTTLHVTKDRSTCLDSCSGLDTGCHSL